MKRDKLLTIRMSAKEMSQLEDIAWSRKLKVSEYARGVLLAPAKSALPQKEEYEVVPNYEQ